MPALLHPGVYVREIPSGVRSIEGVPTSTTIFVGETERGPLEVTRINGRTEFTRLFGGYARRLRNKPDPERGPLLLPYALDGFFANGGTSAYILRLCSGFGHVNPSTVNLAYRVLPGGVSTGSHFIEASSHGTWGNNLSVAAALSTDATSASDRDRMRLAVFYTEPGTTSPVLVEEFDHLSSDPQDESYIVDVLRRSSYIRWASGADPTTAFSNLDNTSMNPFPSGQSLVSSSIPLVGGTGGDAEFPDTSLPVFLNDRLQEVDDAALLVAASSRQMPSEILRLSLSGADFVRFENYFITYASNRPKQDLFFIGELPSLVKANSEPDQPDPLAAAANYATGNGGKLPVTATTYNALYWPHLRVADPIGLGRNPTVSIPPAGYVAGLYAQTDGRRGVWKAPAGTEAQIQGPVQGPEFDVLDVHQDILNPRAVNVLRAIPLAGLVIWGTRTRQPTSEWRYIPVRRTAMFLRKSIYNSIQWAVFEPNDERLWQTLRNTIGAFMDIQFRNGAFAGLTSRQAYFVKVDSETTTPDDQANGIVNVVVGFAPLRPAEFVVVSLQQTAGRLT